MFAQGGDIETVGLTPSEDESYILKVRYLATEYKIFPWDWDSDYPSNKWCPEDINTILQCDIAHYKFQKLSKHPSVTQH
jgi:hypothetical protein